MRGVYEVIAPPELIAMRWDFDDDAVPLPGSGRIAYLRVLPTRGGSRIEVHQHADDGQQAEFFNTAWAMVLGRFAGSAGAEPPAQRARAARPKRR